VQTPVDYSDYIPKSVDEDWLIDGRLSGGPLDGSAAEWADVKLGPIRPMVFAGPSEGEKFVAGLVGWCVSGTWTNIREFNAIRRDSGKIVDELNRQVEAHSEVKLNDVTWGLTDAMGVTNSQAFVDIAKGDTWVSLAAADVSKACVTAATLKGGATLAGKAWAWWTAGASGPLVHMTSSQNAASISSQGMLSGNMYAGPLSNASLHRGVLFLKTTLTPSNAQAAVRIPSSAVGYFRNPKVVGVFTAWQRWAGTVFSDRGSIHLTTGAFTRHGTNWDQMKFYIADLAANTVGAMVASAYYDIWRYSPEEGSDK
jgi:hypothetical protein